MTDIVDSRFARLCGAGKLARSEMALFVEAPMIDNKKNSSEIACLAAEARPGLSGFAVIAALLVMSLVVLVSVMFMQLTQVERMLIEPYHHQFQSRQAARVGVNVALAQLQELAGADQRVTAKADILTGGGYAPVAVPDGQKHWVGVWDTSTFDTNEANNKEFLGWLVSKANGSGEAIDLTDVSDAGVSLDNDVVTLYEGATASDLVQAEKILVEHEDGSRSKFAYWVEDEGVKATVSSFVDAVEDSNGAELDSLWSLSNVDVGAMQGMTEMVNYPLVSESNAAWKEDLGRVQSVEQLGLLGALNQEWDLANRHHFGIYAKGLLTNVRKGGFKKDLSLAFEMDGDEDDVNALTWFNSSEFVSDGLRTENDSTAAIAKAPGHSFYSRYVFTDFPFGIASGTNVRGPSWHIVRDHYNMYKRLREDGNGLVLDARPFYPNLSEHNNGNILTDYKRSISSPLKEYYDGNKYFNYRLSKGNYVPVILGYQFLFSLSAYDHDTDADTAKLALVVDPVFYLWNPYDHRIQLETYQFSFSKALPTEVRLSLKDAAGAITDFDRVSLSYYLDVNGRASDNRTNNINLTVHNFLRDSSDANAVLILEPGEVRIFSGGDLQGEVYPGVNISEDSGYVLKIHPKPPGGGGPSEILIEDFSTTEITAALSVNTGNRNNSRRFNTHSFLLDNADLAAAQGSILKPAIHKGVHYTGLITTYDKPAAYNVSSVVDITVWGSELIADRKEWFGFFTYLTKPSEVNEADEPVEIMSMFNPLAATVQGNLIFFPTRNRFVELSSGVSLSEMKPQSSDNMGYWGSSYEATGSNYVAAFSIPDRPLHSLSQLRHGMLTPYLFENPLSVGNSYANSRLDQDVTVGRENVHNTLFYDSTWYLNDALWDEFFFSGMAPGFEIDGSGYRQSASLEDTVKSFFSEDRVPGDSSVYAHLLPYDDGSEPEEQVAQTLVKDEGYLQSAAHLLMNGMFNVNSTSVAAWAALLGGNRDVTVVYDGSQLDQSSGVPFSQVALPQGDAEDAWAGFARVDDALIWDDGGTPLDESDDTGLAAEIVKQVKLRGPFMSYGDFVNRRLDTGVLGRSGALQTALDAAGVNEAVLFDEGVDSDYSGDFNNADAGSGSTATGINGHVDQADVLDVISPRLSPRSDTFRIHVYGESVDAADVVRSRARCEVVVQRVRDYVDEKSNDYLDLPSELSALNSVLGRKFKIINFKWVNES